MSRYMCVTCCKLSCRHDAYHIIRNRFACVNDRTSLVPITFLCTDIVLRLNGDTIRSKDWKTKGVEFTQLGHLERDLHCCAYPMCIEIPLSSMAILGCNLRRSMSVVAPHVPTCDLACCQFDILVIRSSGQCYCVQ
jgi:hypothetical protein